MKILTKLSYLFILLLLVSSCNKENPINTISEENKTDNSITPVYTLSMSIVQNTTNQSYLLYENTQSFSMFGTSDETFFTRKGVNSTFEVTCTYTWTGNTSSTVAGVFEITKGSFRWNSDYFFASGSSGSNTVTYHNVNLQTAQTYDAIMMNSTFAEHDKSK